MFHGWGGGTGIGWKGRHCDWKGSLGGVITYSFTSDRPLISQVGELGTRKGLVGGRLRTGKGQPPKPTTRVLVLTLFSGGLDPMFLGSGCLGHSKEGSMTGKRKLRDPSQVGDGVFVVVSSQEHGDQTRTRVRVSGSSSRGLRSESTGTTWGSSSTTCSSTTRRCYDTGG